MAFWLPERPGFGQCSDAGIVIAEPAGGYKLSSERGELLKALSPLDAWAKRWAKRTMRSNQS